MPEYGLLNAEKLPFIGKTGEEVWNRGAAAYVKNTLLTPTSRPPDLLPRVGTLIPVTLRIKRKDAQDGILCYTRWHLVQHKLASCAISVRMRSTGRVHVPVGKLLTGGWPVCVRLL